MFYQEASHVFIYARKKLKISSNIQYIEKREFHTCKTQCSVHRLLDKIATKLSQLFIHILSNIYLQTKSRISRVTISIPSYPFNIVQPVIFSTPSCISLREAIVLKGPPWRVIRGLWCFMAVVRSMRNVCSGYHAQTGREHHDSPHTETPWFGRGTPPWRYYVALKVTSHRANSPSLFAIAGRTCDTRALLGDTYIYGTTGRDHVRRPNPTTQFNLGKEQALIFIHRKKGKGALDYSSSRATYVFRPMFSEQN